MTEFISHIDTLSIRPLQDKDSKTHEELKTQLDALNIPADYWEFINRFRVTCVFDKGIYFLGEQFSPGSDEGKESLEVLFIQCDDANNDLLSLRAIYSELLPKELLVIGEVTGGNLVCLDLSSNSGEVKLWDKSSPAADVSENLYHIANSFSEFILMLKEDDDEVLQEIKPRLQNFTLSDDLKAKAAEFLKKQQK